jgi:hypothetical protein
MAKVKKETEIFSEPSGIDLDLALSRGDQVAILPKPDPWPFAATEDRWTKIQALQIDNHPVGWVPDDTVDDSPLFVEPINRDDFAAQCWREALNLSTDAHYLAAMAQFRTGIAGGNFGIETGPFRLIPGEWKFYSADNLLDGGITATDIDDWRLQCKIYAAMARRMQDALTTLLSRAPTVDEICLAQFIGAPATSVALRDTSRTFADALAGVADADLPKGGLTRPDLLQRYKSVLLDAPAVAAPQIAPATGKLPRNLANNNPGNIESNTNTQKWPGYVGSDGRFAKFNTIGDGFRAINHLLDLYARDFHAVTPQQIVAKWAPGSEKGNNTSEYAKAFKQFGQFDPDQPIPNDVDSRARACNVFTWVEGGKNPYSVDQIAAYLRNVPSQLAPAGSIAAAIARLTVDLTTSVEATRSLIEAAGAPFIADDETPERNDATAPPAPPRAAPAAGGRDFGTWFSRNLPGYTDFSAAEFLVKGATNATNHLNTDPPAALWPNIIPTALVLAELKARLGGASMTLTSVYRSKAYNQSIGGVANSQHMRFSATDFVSTAAGGPQAWGSVLKQMRRDNVFSGGIGIYPTFVHVDTRGTNADWA